MNYTIVYLIFLLLIIFLLVNILFSVLKDIPLKIKIITLITILMLILRYLSLIFIFIIQQVQKIYIFKVTVSLNIIAIPCILLLSYYIFLRKDGLKVNFIFIILLILAFMYLLILKFVPVSFSINKVYGYLMKYSINGWIEIMCILILSLVLILCIAGYGLKSSINIGIIGIMISVMVLIVQYILILLGVNLDCNTIIGEGISLIVLKYALLTFKKEKVGL